MKVTVGEKTVNVPDEVIRKSMASLDISEGEAIELYLFDEGIVTNDEVEDMTAKAKAAGPVTRNQGEKTKRKAPVRKPDEMKRTIVQGLFDYIAAEPSTEKIEITNVERMIAFEVGGEKYELTLTKKRKPKE
jgi:hypothetical protein